MKIKICGIRRLLDAIMVDKQGADFLGFINIPRSQRFASLKLIKVLKSQIENKEKAVLVLEPVNTSEVLKKFQITGIKKIQLHSLSPEELESLKNRNLEITRVIGLSNKLSKKKRDEIQAFSEVSDKILLDYEFNGQSGGTGKQIPIKIAYKAAKIVNKSDKDVFLAGGLNKTIIKSNFYKISQKFQGVDVNSGVEEAPGIKDPKKLEELLHTCKVIE